MESDALMETLRYAGTGAVLGLAGGLTPGPLTALVMTQTLQHGVREGIKVALVPVFTDGPLVAASAFLVVSMEGADTALGVSVAGSTHASVVVRYEQPLVTAWTAHEYDDGMRRLLADAGY